MDNDAPWRLLRFAGVAGRSLPYPSPDRLLLIMTTWRGREPVPGLSAPEFFAWRRTADAVESSAAPGVVINQSMARQFWPDENPLGQYLRIGEGAGQEFEETTHRQVVGVGGDVRHVGLEWQARPAAYVPLALMPQNQFSVLLRNGGRVTWAIRSRGHLDTLAASVQRDLQGSSGAGTVSNVRSMLEVSRTSSIGSGGNARGRSAFASR